MGIKSMLRRRAAIKQLTRAQKPHRAQYLAILLSTLSDVLLESLAEEDQKLAARTITPDETSQNYQRFGNLSKMIDKVAPDEDSVHLHAAMLTRLNRLAKAAKRAHAKFYDPSAKGHLEATENMPTVIMFLMHQYYNSGLTPEQEKALIEVTYIDKVAAEDNPVWNRRTFGHFAPNLTEDKLRRNPMRWTTLRILENPVDSIRHWEEYRARIAQSEALRIKLGYDDWEYDAVCDYSTTMIDRLLEIKREYDATASTWDDHSIRIALRENPTEPELNELLELGAKYNDFSGPENYRDMYILKKAVTSLHHYDRLPSYEDYSKAPANVRRDCDALLTVHLALSDVFRGYSDRFASGVFLPDGTIADRRITDFVLDHPEQTERVASIIKERCCLDHDTIQHLLNESTGSALDVGIL